MHLKGALKAFTATLSDTDCVFKVAANPLIPSSDISVLSLDLNKRRYSTGLKILNHDLYHVLKVRFRIPERLEKGDVLQLETGGQVFLQSTSFPIECILICENQEIFTYDAYVRNSTVRVFLGSSSDAGSLCLFSIMDNRIGFEDRSSWTLHFSQWEETTLRNILPKI